MGKSRRAVRLAAGKRGGGHGASPPSFPPPPPRESSRADIANWLGRGGVIFGAVPSKSAAISLETGLNDRLVKMIRSHHRSSQKLAVGKSDYKTIIEAKLKIHCLFDEPVMELMWSLKNLMKSLVPAETCELTMEERCSMSKGMQMILNKHGFNVEPEMMFVGRYGKYIGGSSPYV